MKNKKTPKRRFKGFDGEWEERKVSDIADKTFGGGTPKTAISEYWKGDIPWIQSKDVFEDQLHNVEPQKFITDEAIKLSATKLVPENSIAIVTRVGVGKLAFMPHSYCTSQDFLSLSELNVDCEFATYAIYKMLDVAKENVQGTSIKGIPISEMLGKKIFVPIDPVEQRNVGVFFKNLDTTLTLHQRKIDKLKLLKNSYLQEMFPKNGEKVPKRRFKGFTDDWEQRKLGEMGETYPGLSGKSKDDFGHGDAKFVTYMNVYTNPISNPEMVESVEIDNKQHKVQNGDVFFTTSSETPDEVGMSSVWLENSENTYLNSFCFGYHPTGEIDSNYLAYFLRSPRFRSEMMILAQGISRYNISKNKVMDIDISQPEIAEQKKIGELFRNLDATLTLHQRKLDRLKEAKQVWQVSCI